MSDSGRIFSRTNARRVLRYRDNARLGTLALRRLEGLQVQADGVRALDPIGLPVPEEDVDPRPDHVVAGGPGRNRRVTGLRIEGSCVPDNDELLENGAGGGVRLGGRGDRTVGENRDDHRTVGEDGLGGWRLAHEDRVQGVTGYPVRILAGGQLQARSGVGSFGFRAGGRVGPRWP